MDEKHLLETAGIGADDWEETPVSVRFFQVMLSRSTAAAQSLLGQNFGGILNSDRYNAYNPLSYPRRTVPQSQCRWLLDTPLNGYVVMVLQKIFHL
jgi:hypothetical protein